jgi:hypothetical protein
MKRALTRKTRTSETAPEKPPLTDAQVAENARRKFFNVIEIWRVCRERRCRRARACIGDLERCWKFHIPLIPQDTKTWVKKMFEMRLAGYSSEEASAAADRHLAEVKAAEAAFDAAESACAAPPAVPDETARQPAAPARAPMPRVRTL